MGVSLCRYDFTDGDLAVSLAQLQEYLDAAAAQSPPLDTPQDSSATATAAAAQNIPFQVLRFLFTEINYGGRVTDAKDRRLINTLVEDFCSAEVLQEGHPFSPSAVYTTPCAPTSTCCLCHAIWVGWPVTACSNSFRHFGVVVQSG